MAVHHVEASAARTLGLALLLVGACAACRDAADPAQRSPDPLLVVGIDGATFDRILPLVDAGRLPHLAGLMERGAWGRLETLEPTVSPAIWTTVATGRLPDVHGIHGFAGVPGQTMRTLPTSQMRRVRAFWNILSEQGRSVGVVGWWATWPAEAVDGYVVSDRVAYTRMEATIGKEEARPYEVHPPELTETVKRLVRRPGEITPEEIRRFLPLDDGEVDRLLRGEYRHGDLLPEFQYVRQADRSTADIAVHLLRGRPTDVTAVAFYGVDTVSHLAWHYAEPEAFPAVTVPARDVQRFGGLIDRYYVFVDELLGELLAAAGREVNVVVFSDHGFGPTGQLPWSGGHGRITPGAPIAPDGILVAAGPAIRAGVKLERPHVLDLAPFVLYLQGLPVARDMPGGVFLEAVTPAYASRFPLREIDTYDGTPLHAEGRPLLADEALDEAALQRLCALGYVECPQP